MENFNRKSISKSDIPISDCGIHVSELLSILEKEDLPIQLCKLLDTDAIQDEFIKIKGAKTLVDIQKKLNKRFHKEDLKSKIFDISLYNKKDFSINFNNTKNNEYFQNLNLEQISTIPIYSAKREFFADLYQMDKYASNLIKSGHRSILEENFRMLQEVHKASKRYRILHDTVDSLFYLRGIISLQNYYNYDNNLAIVIALITLHNVMKKSDIEYSLRRCEYNESFIRIFFESSEIKQLETIGNVKSIIEVSNDEIRREALRFTGVCSIEFGNKEKSKNELFIRPQEIKSRIISVGHNRIPRTAIQELAQIDNARNVHSNIFKDILKIKEIKDPEEIKFLVKSKVEKLRNGEVKKVQTQILKELNNSASNIIQLLTIFSKIELLSEKDIEASEYIRFIIYQALIERK